MKVSTGSVHQIVREALDRGNALETKDIRALRTKSEKAVTFCKSVFWAGIVICNLVLWAPLPFQVNKNLLIAIGVISLAVAIIVPIIGLKRHQMNLELLKNVPQAPKKKTADETARDYIDQVRKQGRAFIAAEFELLEGSKWSAKQESP